MATPLDMQPVVDTQLESQKSNILEKTGEACKKLGIAVATAAALHCSAFAQSAVSSSPAAMLQVTKGSGVLTIDGKNMSFTEFLTKYPEQKERSAILGKMDEKTEDAFRDWEISMRKNESSSIEVALNQKKEERKGVNIALNQEDKELVNDKGGLNQKKEERKGVNIALIQITQVNAILDDLMQNQ